MVTNNTALQVTDFDFYGDSLMALKDNATGEVYTAINFVLRGIGFNDIQIRKRRDKWINDFVIGKGVLKFNMPTQGTDQKRSLTYNFDYKDTYCISIRKLPLALAKINITPKMKHEQPELSTKLALYQDKCADVLAAVFIDNQTTSDINTKAFTDTISNLTSILTKMDERLSKLEDSAEKKKLPQKKYSRWKTNTFKKLNTLLSYTNTNSDQGLKLSEVIHLVIAETEDLYDIELNDYLDMYKSEFSLDTNPYTLDVINYYKDIRDMFTLTLDSIMERLHILENKLYKAENIFDVLAEKLDTTEESNS